MAVRPTLLGPDGEPIERRRLTEEISGPTGGGVRSIISGHPAQGLTPQRLAMLLREAEYGDPLRYLELAEEMEEKDLHYLGVIGTRKRAVSGLDVDVIAASDDKVDQDNADLVRLALDRDELTDELFDVLDAVGKGFSLTEIIWDTSASQWIPQRFEWRDPRWFTFDLVDGRTPLLRDESGGSPLPAFKFIRHQVRAKSGLPIRGGLARAVAWCYLFKNYDVRDWVAFAETYGQPMRIGKYGPDATPEDRQVLLRALRNMGVDWAAMVPESMQVELIESKIASSIDLFERLANFLDQQVSKAVLGQTATTDAIQGGYAVGRVHDEVRRDIQEADAVALGATLTRDIAIPVVMLNKGPQARYPRIKVQVPASVDTEALTKALERMVPLGLKVSATEIREKLGIGEPDEKDELLAAPQPAPPPADPADPADPPPGRLPKDFVQAMALARRISAAGDRRAEDDIIDELAREALEQDGFDSLKPVLAPFLDLVDKAGSLEELRDGLAGLLPELDSGATADSLAMATFAARLAGLLEIPSDGNDGR